jgi:hypothetical protein
MRQCLGTLSIALAAASLAFAAPAQAQDRLSRMMAGESFLQGKDLEKAIEQADQHALGAKENPVRVARPEGQRRYLSRLRCSDGKAPKFFRAGNVGEGPFGNIVDLYIVTCEAGEPKESQIHMDMYHKGHNEQRLVPGFAKEVIPEPERAPAPAADPRA